MTRYEKWEKIEDFFRLNLRAYHPDVRYLYAITIWEYAWSCLLDAWDEAGAYAGVKDTEAWHNLVPTLADFGWTEPIRLGLVSKRHITYDIKEPKKSELDMLLPNDCDRLSSKVNNITALYIAFVKMYERKNALDLLEGKSINWKLVKDIEDMVRLGLKAVG